MYLNRAECRGILRTFQHGGIPCNMDRSKLCYTSFCRYIVLTKTHYRPKAGVSKDQTRDGAVWQLVGLITRRSQVQILPPLPSKEIAFEVLLRRRFSLGWPVSVESSHARTAGAEKGLPPRPHLAPVRCSRYHQRPSSTPEGGLPAGVRTRKEGRNRQALQVATGIQSPESFRKRGPAGPLSFPGRHVFTPAKAGTQPRDQGRL